MHERRFWVALAVLAVSCIAGANAAVAEDGPFQVGSNWVSADGKMILTVTERIGELYRARFLVGQSVERIVAGNIKDDKVWWLAKNVRAIKGNTGGDNHGTIVGDRIDFVWRDERGNSGTFTLKLAR